MSPIPVLLNIMPRPYSKYTRRDSVKTIAKTYIRTYVWVIVASAGLAVLAFLVGLCIACYRSRRRNLSQFRIQSSAPRRPELQSPHIRNALSPLRLRMQSNLDGADSEELASFDRAFQNRELRAFERARAERAGRLERGELESQSLLCDCTTKGGGRRRF